MNKWRSTWDLMFVFPFLLFATHLGAIVDVFLYGLSLLPVPKVIQTRKTVKKFSFHWLRPESRSLDEQYLKWWWLGSCADPPTLQASTEKSMKKPQLPSLQVHPCSTLWLSTVSPLALFNAWMFGVVPALRVLWLEKKFIFLSPMLLVSK